MMFSPDRAKGDGGGTSAEPRFVHAGVNPLTETARDRFSTFAVDVDTASYTFARELLRRGQRPDPASVRVEEWVNAFRYEYAPPAADDDAFAIHLAAGPSPFAAGRHILRVGIKGKEVSAQARRPIHLTFLVDVSGSMRASNKLPLARRSLHMLVDQLKAEDKVAIVTYAGRTEELLKTTAASDKRAIHRAIDRLRPGGGTNMGSAMELAYRNAAMHLSDDVDARVIVLSDGDANIGRTSHAKILGAVKGYVSEGVTLSTVGFGRGNYRDHLMERLADAGNGNYSYVDSEAAARRIFVEDLSGTLQVIAQDVKIQVEMNPDVVTRYRLLGYENRDVRDEDFRNDKVDAGEIGAGHTVTALYEVELYDPEVAQDLATVRVRYKQPRGMKASEVAQRFPASALRDRFSDLDVDTQFATALALTAEILRGSPFAEGHSLDDARDVAANAARGAHRDERRRFVGLLGRGAKTVARR